MTDAKKKIATREAYGQTLASLAGENPRIVVLDADLSKSTKTEEFAKVAPERFFNVGIAEQDLIGVGAGLATCGKIPFISGFAIFVAGRGFEQIRNTVCYGRLNVKLAATHAGITVGEDGGSHQAIEDMALMRALPGLTVICPSDGVQTAWAVRAAADYQGPVYLRLGRLALPQIYEESQEFRWGKGQLLRPGADIALIATGLMVSEALEAAQLLAEEGIKAAVADIHTLKPLDTELVLNLAERCGAVLTLEEHSVIGGLGSAVAETLAEQYGKPLAFSRLGVNDVFGQSGSPAALLKHYGLNAEAVATQAKTLLSRK